MLAQLNAKMRSLRAPAAWTASTNFAEGFPYGIVNSIADLFFTEMGASLKAIGLTSLFHVPWNLKFILGPFADAYATKRKWLIALEVMLSIAVLALAVVSTTQNVLTLAPVCFLVLGVLSATHDIAVDGFYLELLTKDQQALFVGSRVTAYRLSLLLCSGPLVIMAKRFSWSASFFAMAAVMFALLAFHSVVLPTSETERRTFRQLFAGLLRLRVLVGACAMAAVVLLTRGCLASTPWQDAKATGALQFPKLAERLARVDVTEWIVIGLFATLLAVVAVAPTLKRRMASSSSHYQIAFVSFLEQPYAARILLYIVLFRVGESFLMKMKFPFLKSAVGLTLEQYGYVNGTLGMIASLVAPAVGGYLIAKRGGLKRWIWPFMLAQNGLHVLFALLAWFAPAVSALGTAKMLAVVTVVVVVEAIGAGLGTAAFTVYIMRNCHADHKAAHMALLTALMSVSFTLAGVLSGFLADAIGFTAYFAFTLVVTLPGMAMTWFVPRIDGPDAPPRICAQ